MKLVCCVSAQIDLLPFDHIIDTVQHYMYIIIQHLEVGYSKHNSELCRLKLVAANICLICLSKSEKL